MTTQKLLIEVATHLSGRPVISIRLQEPVWNNAGGACYKTMDFKAVIDLNPGAEVFTTFLHECAHLKLDWPAMTPSDYWRAEPGSIKSSNETRTNLRALPREGEADKLAMFWNRYAIENCWRYFHASNVFEKKLLALLDYPSE